jgi:hypothetical protein
MSGARQAKNHLPLLALKEGDHEIKQEEWTTQKLDIRFWNSGITS